MITKQHIDDLSFRIIGCAIEVHKELGPGLLESIYEDCMVIELKKKGFEVKTQLMIPAFYKGDDLKRKFKIDLLINDLIILELKAVEIVMPVHKAQLLSYLKLTNKPKGLLINFHSENIVKQIVSYVTTVYAALPVR